MLVISILATAMATAAASSADVQTFPQHRILTNAETGTITHPLIPHKAHLERRRRELHERHGRDEIDLTLPPRPHTSRHSQTPRNDELASQLRGNERNLQQQMGALYQGYGTHYVDLWVGSPDPQRQTVIVDTGSGVTAFPCEECKGCGDEYHTDNYYKHTQSESFRPLQCNECFRGYCASMNGSKKCRISMSYAEGSSWSAYESMDLCYAGGPHDVGLTIQGAQTNTEDIKLDQIDPAEASEFAFELAFGCQVSITGLFITQLADGIMGMENEKTSFWKQMHMKNAIPRPEFSLCFSRNNEAEREGTSAGAMTLGGVDPRLHMSQMVFAKNLKSSGFYAVRLKSVYLRMGGGVSAQTDKGSMGKMHKLNIDENSLNRGNVIVDSGTTDTYFTSALGPHFKAMWKELMGEAYTHSPKSLTPQQIDAMPTIILIMQGYEGDAVGDEANGDPNSVAGYVGDVGELSSNPKDIVLAIPAAHYMEYDPDNGKYVARFYTEESSGSVLGANAMMGHDVFFDIARGRIGFAESNCDYVSLLLSEGTTISVSPHSGASQVSTKTETAVVPEQETAEEEKEMEEEEEMVEKVVEEVYEEAQESEKEETKAPDKAMSPSPSENPSDLPTASPTMVKTTSGSPSKGQVVASTKRPTSKASVGTTLTPAITASIATGSPSALNAQDTKNPAASAQTGIPNTESPSTKLTMAPTLRTSLLTQGSVPTMQPTSSILHDTASTANVPITNDARPHLFSKSSKAKADKYPTSKTGKSSKFSKGAKLWKESKATSSKSGNSKSSKAGGGHTGVKMDPKNGKAFRMFQSGVVRHRLVKRPGYDNLFG